MRAAHESLERTPEGWHRFLGYVIEAGDVRVYHSGDTVFFDGLAEEVAGCAPTSRCFRSTAEAVSSLKRASPAT